jgi:tRNA 5-methylaminomethyl-2-thiouridine biosynthesis bifunctional protein
VTNPVHAHWAGRQDFTVLDTGFGDGARFMAWRQAWLADPARPTRLHYVGMARHAVAPPSAALRALWPPDLPGWHVVDAGPADVQLTLVYGDPQTTARRLDCRADAIDLAGFDPGGDAWAPGLMAPLARLAAPEAIAYGGLLDTAAAMGSAEPLSWREALRTAGFQLDTQSQPLAVAHYRPQATAHRPSPRGQVRGHALVIGAGLAGGWVAHALQQQGWQVTVFDRRPGAAQEASGNPAGLFHGTVLADDGPHARFNRTAALRATRAMAPWIHSGAVPGRTDGLLRLAADGEAVADLQALIDRHALPQAYVQALDASDASRHAGITLTRAAWFYPGGGWVDPAGLVRQLLTSTELRCDTEVASLHRQGAAWQLRDATGQRLAEADTVVLANASDAARLWPAAAWPLGRSRGQISLWPQAPAGAPRPRMPVTGGGYVMHLGEGGLLCGATAAAGDERSTLSDDDHRFNLQRLQQLTGWAGPMPPAGRVAWRSMTPDRLPLVGPVPAAGSAGPLRLQQVLREPGLYVFSGLGSRGITWAPLAARVLAAWISGAPMPVESALRDAIDPARWQVRRARQATARADPGPG